MKTMETRDDMEGVEPLFYKTLLEIPKTFALLYGTSDCFDLLRSRLFFLLSLDTQGLAYFCQKFCLCLLAEISLIRTSHYCSLAASAVKSFKFFGQRLLVFLDLLLLLLY